MADIVEPFTLVEKTARPGTSKLFNDVVHLGAAQTADHDLSYLASLREANPGLIVTAIPAYNIPLRAFAAAGYASCELDTTTDGFASWRGFRAPPLRQRTGSLAETVHFAKYRYIWNDEAFFVYVVKNMQYVLKERRDDEDPMGPSKITDKLIKTVGAWMLSDQKVVWVYDLYWQQSKALYQRVMTSSWDKVILDESMKKDLTTVTNKFFSSKQSYEDLGVPWKRGLMFHGPPGNGKTVSIKAIMHNLLDREDPIPTLYVKSAPNTWDISAVFNRARQLSPCMLILEDVETIVTERTRSYFFNEMDGLQNNDGILVVASTNYLDRLDPGLTKRPSRFDRKYLFPLPNEHERTLYCEYWRHKLRNNDDVVFPKKLSPAMAHITPGFSFAFLQECFVATLLEIAREGEEVGLIAEDDLTDYELWRVFKKQADILRKEMSDQGQGHPPEVLGICEPSLPIDGCKLPIEIESTVQQQAVDGKIPDLQHLYSRDETLPGLESQYNKQQVLNSAAFMWR